MKIAGHSDLIHKFELFRLLTAIVDNSVLSQGIYFKGGTFASMAGFLDRFSVDLDFDLKKGENTIHLRNEFKKVFKNLDLKIENKNERTLFFVLKYKSTENQRNTIKLSVFEDTILANDYKPFYLPEIDRLVNCQTVETMFANKLVAPVDRFKKHKKVAGRDIYDIHYFFSQGYKFKEEIIKERTGYDLTTYIKVLINFLEREVTEQTLSEDLSSLLPYEKFKKIRKSLKSETILFLRNLINSRSVERNN
jgi:predicted nucleotidyltransferase component of viral defense system